MAVWPSTLGVPLVAGYRATSEPRVLSTTMSSGPRSQGACVQPRCKTIGTVSFMWDAAQKRTFDTFFNVTLRKGTIPASEFPLDLVDGVTGHLTWLSAPSLATVTPDNNWRVTFSFETEEREPVLMDPTTREATSPSRYCSHNTGCSRATTFGFRRYPADKL